MRVEPELAGNYRKNPREEAFLREFNALLSERHDLEYREHEEHLPTLYVVGAPRSGTTLLYQLLATHLDVGYINNLIAAFWRAPLYGIRLSSKLIPEPPVSTYESAFGRTAFVHEPHEFGYFWSELLRYEEALERGPEAPDPVNWARVRRTLINMAEEFGRPTLFKSLYVSWHAGDLYRLMPRSCFVRIRRNPVDTAVSILKTRREFSGSINSWVSLKPREYAWLKDLSPWEQVAGQVYYLEAALERQLAGVSADNLVDVTYEELCRTPRRALARVQELVAQHGGELRSIGQVPECFTFSSHGARRNTDYLRVREAVHRFYDQTSVVA